MIELSSTRPKKERDSTIALINIVFLMLIFFLIAGTIVPPLDRSITPADVTESQNAELEGVLGIRADGTLVSSGQQVSMEAFFTGRQTDEVVRILPDRNLNAAELIDIMNRLKDYTKGEIRLVTERS